MQSSLFQLLITKTIMLTLLDLHSGLICQNCILVLGDGRGGKNGAFAFHEYREKKPKNHKGIKFSCFSQSLPAEPLLSAQTCLYPSNPTAEQMLGQPVESARRKWNLKGCKSPVVASRQLLGRSQAVQLHTRSPSDAAEPAGEEELWPSHPRLRAAVAAQGRR